VTGHSISLVRTLFLHIDSVDLHWLHWLALDRTTIVDPLCHRPIGFGHDCASSHIQFLHFFIEFRLNWHYGSFFSYRISGRQSFRWTPWPSASVSFTLGERHLEKDFQSISYSSCCD
jgi:hypothetical protein